MAYPWIAVNQLFKVISSGLLHLALAANLNHWYLRSAVAVHPAQQVGLVAEQRSLDALDFKQTTDQLTNGGRQRINASASRPNYYSLLRHKAATVKHTNITIHNVM